MNDNFTDRTIDLLDIHRLFFKVPSIDHIRIHRLLAIVIIKFLAELALLLESLLFCSISCIFRFLCRTSCCCCSFFDNFTRCSSLF